MYRVVILSKQTDCQHDKVDTNKFLNSDDYSVGGRNVTEQERDASTTIRGWCHLETTGTPHSSHLVISLYSLAIP